MNCRYCRTGRSPGFVLLTVILVGALLFVSAFMFVSQLTTESHVTKTDAYFKSALNLAETGLNNALMKIGNAGENAVDPPTWVGLEVGHTYDFNFGTTESSEIHGTYSVKLVVGPVEAPDLTHPDPRAEVQITSTGRVYPPSVTSMVGTGYVARRAVQMSTMATWRAGTSNSYKVKFGIFTAGDLMFADAASYEIDGDVMANGNVTVKDETSVVSPNLVLAHGTITGYDADPPDGRDEAGVPSVPFPEIDIARQRVLFDAYLEGKYPYNALNNQIPGAPAGTFYTCTDSSVPGNHRADFNVDLLSAVAVNSTVRDPLDSSRWLKVLPGGDITPSVALAMKNPTAVYFFDGAVSLPRNGVTAAWAGTVVINGDFEINSNITVGGATPVRLLVNGNITKDNGCSTINGLVYTSGAFVGNGTADIFGALMAKTSVTISGALHISYDDTLEALEVEGLGLRGFLLLQQSIDKRAWQEVVPPPGSY